MAGIGDKLLTASEIKEVTDTKVDNDFTKLSALPNGLADTDLFNVRRSGTNYKLSALDLIPLPLVITIPTGQWIESNDDYYISVTASNVNENSILIPSYDHDSESVLKGPVWCVPDDGSFTIHTSVLPSGTVTILAQFIGVVGEAQYQVLADVYSKDQAVAKADIVNNLTSTATDQPLSANMGKTLNDKLTSMTLSRKSYTINMTSNSYVSPFNAVGTYTIPASDIETYGTPISADAYTSGAPAGVAAVSLTGKIQAAAYGAGDHTVIVTFIKLPS